MSKRIRTPESRKRVWNQVRKIREKEARGEKVEKTMRPFSELKKKDSMDQKNPPLKAETEEEIKQ